MAVVESGLSTLEVLLGYAVESTANTKPASFIQLERINNIAGIALDVEQIDSSSLEDKTTKYIAGRQDTGGTWTVTINLTDETTDQLETMITAYETAKAAGKRMWFEVYHPDMDNGFFVVAQPPKVLPMPEFGQNSLLTIDLELTIEEYIGQDTAIKPVAAS